MAVWGKNARLQPTIDGVPRLIRGIYDAGMFVEGGTWAQHVAGRDFARYKLDIVNHVQSGTFGNGLHLANALQPLGMYCLAIGNFFGNFTFAPEDFIPASNTFDIYKNPTYTIPPAAAAPFRTQWLAHPAAWGTYISDEPAWIATGWYTTDNTSGHWSTELYGTEKVVNGTFPTNLGSWTNDGSVLATWDGAGRARLTPGAQLRQTMTVTPVVQPSDAYRLICTLTADTGGARPICTVVSNSITLYDSSVNPTIFNGKETFPRPTGTTLEIKFVAGAGAGFVDDVSLFAVGGDPPPIPATRGRDATVQLQTYCKSVLPTMPTFTAFLNDNITQSREWGPYDIGDWLGSDIYTIGKSPELHPDNSFPPYVTPPGTTPDSTYGYMNFSVSEACAIARYYNGLHGRVSHVVLQINKFGNTSRYITTSELWSHMVTAIAELRGCGAIFWWALGTQDGALDERPFAVYSGNGSQTVFALPEVVDELVDVEYKLNGVVQSGSTYTVQNLGDRSLARSGNFWTYANPPTITMNTPPPSASNNIVLTVWRWPQTKRTAAKDMLDLMTTTLFDLEPILLQPSNPALLTGNSNITSDFLTWRIAYCNLLRSQAPDKPVWLFGAIGRYQEEYDFLRLTPPNYSSSLHIMDQAANVRTCCWESGDIGIVAAHNIHPDAQPNVTLQWHRTVTRVEVLGESRDIAVTGGRSWTDTFGGASSLRQGPSNTGHLYKLYMSAQGTSPQVMYVSAPSGSVDTVTLNPVGFLAVNDIALLIVEAKEGSPNILPAISVAGGFTWTFIGWTVGTSNRSGVWWARTPASYSAVTLADTGDHTFATLLGIRGCKLTGDPVNGQSGGNSVGPQTTTTIPGLTTTVDNCLLVDIVCLNGPDWPGSNNFSNWANAAYGTPIERVDQSTPAGVGATIGVLTSNLTSGAAGAVPATTVTHVSQMSLFRKIALAPEPNPADNGSATITLAPLALVATGTAAGGIFLNTILADVTLAATGTAAGGSAGNYPTVAGLGAVAASVDPITPTLPAGLLLNDILVLSIQTTNGVVGVANGGGGVWTQAAAFNPANNGVRLSVYWSRFNGTQTAPTTTDSGDHQLGRIIALRGCTTANPPYVVSYDAPNFAQTATAILAVTTAAANALVLDIIAGESAAAAFTGWTNTNLVSLTQRANDTTAVGLGGALALATGGKAVAGATGTTTLTHANTRVAFMKMAFTPQPGTATVVNTWGVDAKGRVTLNNAPMMVRLIYDSGFAGATGTDMAGHVTARNYARFAGGKLNVVIHEMSGSSENGLRLMDAIQPLGMYHLGVGNAFGSATVDDMSAAFHFDLVINPNNYRSRFAAHAAAAGVALGNEPADSVMANMEQWYATYKTDMPNLEMWNVLFQDPIGQVLTFAPSPSGKWFAADPYPIGSAAETTPDGGTTISTYGYMNFSVGQAAARIRYHALRNGKAPMMTMPMLKLGALSRFVTTDEMWSFMVAVFAEGCHGIAWWAFGVQQGALDQNPFSLYAGDGAATVFAVPSYFEEAADVWVEIDGVLQSTGVYTLQGLGAPAGPWTVTMTTPPPIPVPLLDAQGNPRKNIVVTNRRWPTAKRTAMLDHLETVTTFLRDYEGILLSDPRPDLLTFNSTTTGNPLTWRRNLAGLLASTANDRPCWWWGVRSAYEDEYARLNLTPPDTTLSDQMLDQSSNVRTRCWLASSGLQALVFAYNIHPDAQNNVTLQWATTVQRVEVVDESRDVALAADNRSWTDTFGGGSSLRQGARRQGHVYRLHLGGAPPPSAPDAPTISSLGGASTTSVGVGLGAGTGATTHGLYRGSAAAFPRDPAHLIASFTTTVPATYLDSNLTPNTTYFYRLVATNAVGSTESGEISVATLAPADAPTGLFWAQGQQEFLPWPGRLLATSVGTYEFALQTQPGAVPAAVTGYVILLDAGDIGEIVHDVAIAVTTGSRLPLTKTYRVIKSVSLTLIDDGAVPPNVAVTARVIDKDAALGPLIRCYNSVGTVVAGHVDAGIVGY